MHITQKLLAITLIVLLAIACEPPQGNSNISEPAQSETVDSSEKLLQEAFKEQKNDLQVGGQGKVIKLLSDDLDGSKHQRFIIKLSSGQTLLVAHNIDLAPRIKALQVGDMVTFYGEYEWNPEGGVIHWTHHDPAGEHIGGWIKHDGKIYQ
ncbi:pf11948 family protein [Leptolyngbya sp. Heron Island J]|uniref:DUF3465 domain-containing protein n=1 Tax=Leptolyngbya sp. Heron Island J TaxID=1385935 RepID=UPI0003B96AAE|nr:DUF3465 domain-containing protein [Leptolyngbya sp. Heron Island J]ESA34285.1 pf11948 family protein [Leptolyngbya sp. Heron Island J]